MNLVALYGRLTRDPEMKYFQDGTASVYFTVAVERNLSKEKRREAEEQNKPTADFIRCKAFGKTAEVLGLYFKKGNRIALEGRIQTGSYEKDGQRVYTTDVIVSRLHFVETAAENQQAPQKQEQTSFAPKDNNAGYYPIDRDDVPF